MLNLTQPMAGKAVEVSQMIQEMGLVYGQGKTFLASSQAAILDHGEVAELGRVSGAVLRCTPRLYAETDERRMFDVGVSSLAKELNALRQEAPRFYRVDAVVTSGGLRVAEIESIPAGLGYMSSVYEAAASAGIIGADHVPDYAGLFVSAVGMGHPVVGIAVCADRCHYRRDSEVFAQNCLAKGHEMVMVDPHGVVMNGRSDLPLVDGKPMAVHVRAGAYRYSDVPAADEVGLIECWRSGAKIHPPLQTIFWSKAEMASLWKPELQEWWRGLMGGDLDVAHRIFPQTAYLDGRVEPGHIPDLGTWECVKNFDRRGFKNWVIKGSTGISGGRAMDFGSHDIVIGAAGNMDTASWRLAVQSSLDMLASGRGLRIIQRFSAPIKIQMHTIANKLLSSEKIVGQLRPLARIYYAIIDGESRFMGGTLNCRNSLVVHGASDAVLAPIILG